MNKIILILLVSLFAVTSFAQQLEDGISNYVDKQIGLEVIIDVQEEGNLISDIKLVLNKDTTSGNGYWVQAPRYSDMEGGGWYEASINNVPVEIDVISDDKIKITQNIEGVNVNLIVEKY
jgi:hypothetical protein